MTVSPGQFRQFAAQARHDAEEYHAKALAAKDGWWRRHYEQSAINRAEHAEWYQACAERGEITTDYAEAAE